MITNNMTVKLFLYIAYLLYKGHHPCLSCRRRPRKEHVDGTDLLFMGSGYAEAARQVTA
jgi:hypothetical protein